MSFVLLLIVLVSINIPLEAFLRNVRSEFQKTLLRVLVNVGVLVIFYSCR